MLIVALVGCVPYSGAVGQTAAPLRSGGVEVGATIGVGYQKLYEEDVEPPDAGGDSTIVNVPRLEANVLYGLSEKIGLDLHGSDAGLQPGLKISARIGTDVDVALLPAFGFGRWSQAQEDAKLSGSSVLVGGRAILSMPDSIYAAAGYDFQRIHEEERAADGDTDGQVITIHNVTASIGLDLALGGARLRPELGVIYAPFGRREDDENPDARSDVARMALFPSVTIAVATP